MSTGKCTLYHTIDASADMRAAWERSAAKQTRCPSGTPEPARQFRHRAIPPDSRQCCLRLELGTVLLPCIRHFSAPASRLTAARSGTLPEPSVRFSRITQRTDSAAGDAGSHLGSGPANRRRRDHPRCLIQSRPPGPRFNPPDFTGSMSGGMIQTRSAISWTEHAFPRRPNQPFGFTDGVKNGAAVIRLLRCASR